MLTAGTTLDKQWIAAHIPHQGNMCLLDHVSNWDAQSITCMAVSHQDTNNPLRSHGQLNTACGIEYAAQAMAVHGAALAPADQERPKAGFLVSIRGATVRAAVMTNTESLLGALT